MYLFVFLGVVLACNPSPNKKDHIASVGNSYLGTKEFERLVPANASVEEKNRIINNWINQELLFQEALKRRLQETAVLKKQLEQTQKDLLIAALIDTEFGQKEISVEKSDVNQYYDVHKDSYVRSEPEIQARHILISSLRDALALRTALREGADFTDLAHEYSEDLDTYHVGGDLGLFTQSTEPILWMACISLELNTVSSPIQTDYGYHLIEVMARYEEGSLRKINEIQEQITEAVVWQKHRSRMQKLIASLKKNADWMIRELP
ncbi:MAG: peptidylprolyl isomerase [Candidatus Latescibacterota bacterium]|nr:peptidylprolyl isomerase [Candidatus Latescibacterota bacterium]